MGQILHDSAARQRRCVEQQHSQESISALAGQYGFITKKEAYVRFD